MVLIYEPVIQPATLKENGPTVLTYFPIVNYEGFVTNAAKTFGHYQTAIWRLVPPPLSPQIEPRERAAPKLDFECEHLQIVDQILMGSEPPNYNTIVSMCAKVLLGAALYLFKIPVFVCNVSVTMDSCGWLSLSLLGQSQWPIQVPIPAIPNMLCRTGKQLLSYTCLRA